MRDAERIAAIVNEWFQGEPTPERQQNMRRTSLINEMVAVVTEARNDWYASNRRIAYLESVLANIQRMAYAFDTPRDPGRVTAFVGDLRQMLDRVGLELAREHGNH